MYVKRSFLLARTGAPTTLALVVASAIGLTLILTRDVGQAAEATGVLEGRVVEVSTGRALAGATVDVQKSPAKGRTGTDGRYRIDGIAPGTYSVRCVHPGHRPSLRKSIQITAGQTTTLRFELKPAGKAPPRDVAVAVAEKADISYSDEAPMAIAPEPAAAPMAGARGPGRAAGKGSPSSRSQNRPSRSKQESRRRPKRGMRKMAKRSRAPSVRPAAVPLMMAPPSPPPPPGGIATGEAHPGHNTEAYDVINENEFQAVRQNPLSTFSIDVDTASYANTRRFIENSRVPPRDAVRIEELINYFTYDYPNPKGPHPFSVTTEVSVAPWNPAHRMVLIGLQGRKIETEQLPPSNLVFLLDVSGSMNNANKLPLLKTAFKLLVNHLRPSDRVAIVVYAGAAGVVLPSTPGKDRERILGALDRLRAGGSTAGGAGIKLAYKIAQENFIRGGNNRIILGTDGDFNVGQSSDSNLVQLIEKKRKSGVFLTILGFGMGNYKDAKMQKLADKGNGNHAYIDSVLEAKKVLVSEMGGTLVTIAKDVKLQIEFNPTRVKGYRLIGYENRMLRAQDFNDDTKDAGELGAGHSVTALYELIPAGSREAIAGVDELKYQETVVSSAAGASEELLTVKLRYKAPDGDKSKLIVAPLLDEDIPVARTSNNFRFATAVAEFGMLLRGSKFKGQASFAGLLQRARGAAGEDREGYRYDFVKLAQKAEILTSTQSKP